jgi:acetyl esterase/lipase
MLSNQAFQYPATVPIPPNTKSFQGVPYVANGVESQKLDLYLPPGRRNPPIMVLIHGGAWLGGDKAMEAPGLWLKEGYAVACVNYRLLPGTGFPGQLEDCKAAVRWLRKNASRYDFDKTRVGAAGESAGGYFTAMLGATSHTRKFDVGENLDESSEVQVACDWFGITDITTMDAQRLPDGMRHGASDTPESMFIGATVSENKRKALAASAITYLDKHACPFFITHGDRDTLVPCGQSLELRDALQKLRIRTKLMIVKGGGHMFMDKDVTHAMVEFVNGILKP